MPNKLHCLHGFFASCPDSHHHNHHFSHSITPLVLHAAIYHSSDGTQSVRGASNQYSVNSDNGSRDRLLIAAHPKAQRTKTVARGRCFNVCQRITNLLRDELLTIGTVGDRQ